MNKIEVENLDELQKVVECVKKSKKKIVILSGPLGSGKTTFVKEFAKSLNIDDEVTSPTFSIQNVYQNKKGEKIFHYDLYNKSFEEFLALGMAEELEKEGYHFIEWGEELEKFLRKFSIDYLKIEIEVLKDKRNLVCISTD